MPLKVPTRVGIMTAVSVGPAALLGWIHNGKGGLNLSVPHCLGETRGTVPGDSHADVPRGPLGWARGQAAGAKNCGIALRQSGGGKIRRN